MIIDRGAVWCGGVLTRQLKHINATQSNWISFIFVTFVFFFAEQGYENFSRSCVMSNVCCCCYCWLQINSQQLKLFKLITTTTSTYLKHRWNSIVRSKVMRFTCMLLFKPHSVRWFSAKKKSKHFSCNTQKLQFIGSQWSTIVILRKAPTRTRFHSNFN